jgi:hypothetical protein
MELPSPPWYRRWSVILAGVIGMAAITGLLGLRGFQDVADPSPTTPAQPAVPVPTTASPSTSPGPTTTTTVPGLLWDREGRDLGNVTSPGIRAPSTWHIDWSFDCSNFRKYGGGGFKITGNGDFDQLQIQEQKVKASGSQTFHRGGYGHLHVESVCKRWHVKVREG